MYKETHNARREYYKQWRAKNKDKISEYNKNYWKRKEMREAMPREEVQNNVRDSEVSDD